MNAAMQLSRHIALVKPSGHDDELVDHALQLFDSMLWVFRGTLRSEWKLSPPAEADVIVLHHAEAATQGAVWKTKGKVIVVLSTDKQVKPTHEHTLVYPFPATQVMGLLERLDVQLGGGVAANEERAYPKTRPLAYTTDSQWAFVDAIKTVRDARNPDIWLEIRDADAGLMCVRGDGEWYQARESVRESLRNGSLSHLGLFLDKAVVLPPGTTTHGDELAWFAGYYASVMLAPWLNTVAVYRLKRWPDFGLLRTSDGTQLASQLRVVACLDAQPSAFEALSQRARVSHEQLARTLNALSVCGLLEEVRDAAPATRTKYKAPQAKGGLRQLFNNIRKHLSRRSSK